MKKGCFEAPVFKALSLSNLDFSLPSTDEQSFRGVLRFADYLGHDAEAKRSRYRLSLAKCATLSPDELGRLARHGVHLSEDVVGEVSRLRMDRLVSLTLQGGDLVITATPGAEDLLMGHAVYEPKTRTYRAKPKDLWDVLHSLEGGCRVNLDLDVRLGLSFQPNPLFRLRPYQAQCYDAWRSGGCRGVIALPTAAGKTFLAPPSHHGPEGEDPDHGSVHRPPTSMEAHAHHPPEGFEGACGPLWWRQQGNQGHNDHHLPISLLEG